MNSKAITVLLSGLLFACVQTPPPEAAAPSAPSPPAASAPAPAPAQPSAVESAPTDHIVNIQRASCQDLLRLSPEDRAAATMFYIGYQASRLRATTINVGVIPSIEAQAVIYCQENPDQPVARAFAQAYLQNQR